MCVSWDKSVYMRFYKNCKRCLYLNTVICVLFTPNVVLLFFVFSLVSFFKVSALSLRGNFQQI